MSDNGPVVVRQVSPLPTAKVMAGAAAGAVALIVVWIVETWGTAHGQPIHVPSYLGMAFTTVATFITQYLVPPSSRDVVVAVPTEESQKS